jgi:uncharacterized protein (TIGR01777 family)
MVTVIITGGTGLIGTALTGLLISKGYKVVILSRRKHAAIGNVSYALWDLKTSYIDPEAIKAADHIIHLAGAGVADKWWTEKRKKEIVNSRVDSSKIIVKALTELNNTVQTVVCASAMGWYGLDSKGHRPFVETDPPSDDFLGSTCKLWEESIRPVSGLNKRLIYLRTGIVFSTKGGAFKEFLKPFKGGIAAILGSGKQIISWIQMDDLCRMYLAAIENKQMHGPYNACAPETISNKDLMLKIARARKRPYIPVHIPEFALKIVLGEMSIEVLKSATMDDTKIMNTGFNFIFPTVDAALNELVSRR